MTSMKDNIKVEVTGDADSSEIYVENTIEDPALYTIEDNRVSLVSENVEKVIKVETNALDDCIFESKFEIVKDVAYQSNMELLLDSQDVADNSIHVNHGNTSDKIFLCDICGKIFVSNHLLKNHLTEHKKQVNYNTNKCKFCKKQFKLKFGLNTHIQKHHNSMYKYSKYIENKKYDEKIDQPRFDTIPNINGTQFLSRDITGRYSSDHTRLVKSNATIESTVPHTYIPSNNIISNPEQTEILLNTLERNSSDQIGLVSRNSIIVSTASQNSIQFNPTETESTASDSETMPRKQNKKNKSITKTNFCNLCNRKFTKRCYFTNHMIMKHNVNTNIPKQLTSIDYNKSIIPSANTEMTNEYENKLSVPVNYKNNNLNNHVSKSNKKKSIICLICNTLFAHLGALKSHMRIHGSKTYKCQYCYMQFDKKGICTMHEKTHCKSNLPEFTSNKATNISTKSGRFECNICMKTYSTSYNLKKHKKNVHKVLDSTPLNSYDNTCLQKNKLIDENQ
ncbi:unnamed protein product [Macrosiphum euphorbiae]|uniref:C2H2-type domain-containing protein n=1 Tax=Macrosiphum euphorbiae TaxID=13131 RepID=A0AAV0WPW7_9HEMI|nr:unnamed protein product [Macrosiphum euphorbiae]